MLGFRGYRLIKILLPAAGRSFPLRQIRVKFAIPIAGVFTFGEHLTENHADELINCIIYKMITGHLEGFNNQIKTSNFSNLK
jgi:hypothetical protein